MDIFQKNSTIGLKYGLSECVSFCSLKRCVQQKNVTSNFISFALEMFRSNVIQVLSVYYSDVLNTLKNFCSILPEKLRRSA